MTGNTDCESKMKWSVWSRFYGLFSPFRHRLKFPVWWCRECEHCLLDPWRHVEIFFKSPFSRLRLQYALWTFSIHHRPYLEPPHTLCNYGSHWIVAYASQLRTKIHPKSDHRLQYPSKFASFADFLPTPSRIPWYHLQPSVLIIHKSFLDSLYQPAHAVGGRLVSICRSMRNIRIYRRFTVIVESSSARELVSHAPRSACPGWATIGTTDRLLLADHLSPMWVLIVM